MQSWCRTWPPNGSSRIRAKQKLLRKHKGACKSSWRSHLHWQFLGIRQSLWSSLLESLRVCTTQIRNKGIAEGAVCRVKEGASAVLLQSGLNESWWADSVECYTYLRNVTDFLSDGKTPCERRFGQPFKGPIIPFGSVVEYHPITAKENPSIWKESLTWIVPRTCIVRGSLERWRTDRRPWGVGDDGRIWNLLEKTQCKWGDISPKNGKLLFQSQMDESKPLEEIRTWEHPPWYGIDQFKERVILTFLENQKGLFHNLKTHFRMPVKHEMIFGPCQETSYTAITLNQESNFTRRERNHSLFHWSTLTFPERHIRIWMSSRRNASMITGISMGHETCQILGQVSHNLL